MPSLSRRELLLAGASAAAVLSCDRFTIAAQSDVPKLKTGKPIRLFNGKNLDGFYTFLRETGKDSDPKRVFTVQDGVIRVSGEDYGQFETEQEFENYHLSAEFKWGEETHGARKGKARDSGLLFHCVGPDKVWNRSIEFQIIEGGTGDCILVDGATMLVNGQRTSRRQDRMNKGPWKDEVGYRDPSAEVEKPHDEWNRLDLIADGDTAQYFVNGKLVNKLAGLDPHKGKILFQSEGAEVFYRRIELRPLLK